LLHKKRNEAEARPIAGSEGGTSPFFSPDGRWIGFIAGGRVRKAPVEGGAPITIASDANPNFPSAAWLDDGTIVYVSADNYFRRVSSEGGTGTPLWKKNRNSIDVSGLLAPLPGSRGVLFTSCPGNCSVSRSVWVLDFAADTARVLIPDAAGGWFAPTGHLLYTDQGGSLFAVPFDPESFTLSGRAIPVLEDVLPGSFTLSASGSALYAVAGGGALPSELVWVSREGQVVPVDSGWRQDFQYPAISPDGRSVAVSVREENAQLWIRRVDGARQRLTDSGSVNWRPAWTADGRSIVFISNRGSAGQDNYNAWQVPVDGSAPPTLLEDYQWGVWEVERSPDGEWLVFRADEEGNLSRIRARRLTGDTTMQLLVAGKTLLSQLALSPDGRWLAYMSDVSGRREVYVTSFPSVNATHLVSQAGGSEPRWSRNGRELFFKANNTLMAAAISSTSSFAAGTPVPLFSVAPYRSARNRQQYDVAPDGRRFLMIREVGSDRPENVVYVENWVAELKERLRAGR
jgi:serine/threonine-protein kinase